MFPFPSWLPALSPALLAGLVAVLFLFISFPGRDPFYWVLSWFLETDVVFFKIIGELVSLMDAFIKGSGIYLFANLIGVSILPTPLGSVLVLSLFVFESRYFVYPAAFKSVTTTSRLDDVVFILDIPVRTLGIYQVVFWGLVGYRLV